MGVSSRAMYPDRDASTMDAESEVHAVTTVPPVNIPNHQPVFRGMLLHEHLLTRDFQGDQHFFSRDGSLAAYSTVPGSVSDPGDPVTQLVPHEDAPAFSDIATTATAAATTPLTTFSPTTPRPPMSLPQKKSPEEKIRGEDKVEPTTDSLTTQVMPNNRGPLGEKSPVASSSTQRGRSRSWSASPAEATLAPSSMRMEKGEARETDVKNKSGPDQTLRDSNPAPHDGGTPTTTTTSTTVTTTTTITTMQTAGMGSFILSLTFSDVPSRTSG